MAPSAISPALAVRPGVTRLPSTVAAIEAEQDRGPRRPPPPRPFGSSLQSEPVSVRAEIAEAASQRRLMGAHMQEGRAWVASAQPTKETVAFSRKSQSAYSRRAGKPAPRGRRSAHSPATRPRCRAIITPARCRRGRRERQREDAGPRRSRCRASLWRQLLEKTSRPAMTSNGANGAPRISDRPAEVQPIGLATSRK